MQEKLDNEVVPTYVTEIRELAYDAEDVNESFLLKLASKRKASFEIASLISLKRDVCSVESQGPYPHIIDKNVVGLDVDIKKLVSLLGDEETHGTKGCFRMWNG
ncbi:hypothetical protein Golob_027934 [Gossypium lobatum]|uniref:Rx N-terminal domain-containing protein n=1 Tax=Gossypium lobatum TaxID=34289 RepID=A0A7J8NIA4_9ROSI|nr:hypothetical protein [Gossypium lobatum]